jgi:hypothetical protein
VDRGEHDADRLRLPLGQEDLCLSLALYVQDRGLFGACGGDPAVAEIEQMIHRKPRRGHIIYPHREQAGVVRAEHTHWQVRGLQGRATSSSVGARLATRSLDLPHRLSPDEVGLSGWGGWSSRIDARHKLTRTHSGPAHGWRSKCAR